MSNKSTKVIPAIVNAKSKTAPAETAPAATAPAATAPSTTTSVVIGPAGSVLSIPREMIEVPVRFNARIGYKTAEMQALTTSLRRDGLLQPIVVRASKGGSAPYVLVAGFRRFMCYCGPSKDGIGLDRPSIPATIMDAKTTDLDAKYANLAENVARDNLSAYSIAVRCQDLSSSYGESGNKIADRLGLSKGYVNNLIKCVGNLIPQIQARWAGEVGDGPMPEGPEGKSKVRVCTTDWLNKIVKMSADEQLAAFNGALGIVPEKTANGADPADVAADAEENAAGTPGGVVAVRRATLKALETMKAQIAEDMKAIKSKDRPTSTAYQYLRGAFNALEMAIGVRPSIDGVKIAEKTEK